MQNKAKKTAEKLACVISKTGYDRYQWLAKALNLVVA
jgi:hypothetical protein